MEISRIIVLLENSFDGHAWHGPSVMETLSKVTAEEADFMLPNKTHTMNELVLHMASWRNFVAKKLRDEKFEMTEALNFPKPDNWNGSLSILKQSQVELVKALNAFPDDKLYSRVPGRDYNFYTLLHGVIQHDIYHLGQIVIIRKSFD